MKNSKAWRGLAESLEGTKGFYKALEDLLTEIGVTPPEYGTKHDECIDTILEALYKVRSMKTTISLGGCCFHCDYFEVDQDGDGFCEYHNMDTLWVNVCDSFKEQP